MPMTRLKKITGEIIGRVTNQSLGNGPAPSIMAASYSSVGTPCSAARYRTMPPPTPHILMTMKAGSAQVRSKSQAGPGIPTSARMRLMTPASGLSSNSHIMATAAPETTAGV